MPRGRPPIISDERLLEVAREVFLERGIRATTAEVAKRAGVSEATVFHRYKTKDALFRAALSLDFDRTPPYLEDLEQRVSQGEPADHLHEIGMAMIEEVRRYLPLLMMSWSNPEAMLHQLSGSGIVTRIHELLRRYLEAERRAGRLPESSDPRVMTLMFYGSIHGFLMHETIAPRIVMPADTFVRGLVQTLVGTAPRAAPAPAPTTSGAAAPKRKAPRQEGGGAAAPETAAVGPRRRPGRRTP